MGRLGGLLTRLKNGKADGAAADGAEEQKKKLTRREREEIDKKLRANLPSRASVGANGIYEMSGKLHFTHAVGNIPAGKFIGVHAVLQGHRLYLFEGTLKGGRPTAKPFMFLTMKRAVLEDIGLLIQDPPLPPHSNVFKVSFPIRKQYGHRAYFFKASSGAELKEWIKDLSWRVNASQAELADRFGIMRGAHVHRRSDETEAAVGREPTRLCGLSVRYEPRQLKLSDEDEEGEDKRNQQEMDPVLKAKQQQRLKEKADAKKKAEKEAMLKKRATFSLLTDNRV